MEVPKASSGSFEHQLHQRSIDDRLLVFQESDDELYKKKVPHSAMGVVYDPDREAFGNYVPTISDKRYDAFMYLDVTTALHPLHLHPN